MRMPVVLVLVGSCLLLAAQQKPDQAARPSTKSQRAQISELTERVSALEAENASLRAENEKLTARNKEITDGFRNLLADADNLAATGKNLLDEHRRLGDRYNDLIRDYNNVIIQTEGTLTHLRLAADEQARSCRSAQRSQALANWINSIPKFQTPQLVPYVPPPAIRTMFQCTTVSNGAFGGSTTTCR
jgi:cell division protein FtsB